MCLALDAQEDGLPSCLTFSKTRSKDKEELRERGEHCLHERMREKSVLAFLSF